MEYRTTVLLEDRFWSKVHKTDGCWLWTAQLNHWGYGLIRPGGSLHAVLAHRVSWELHLGPIPEGLFVLHRCDIRHCVRPSHLFLGTRADNTADMLAKGRGSPPPIHRGEKQALAKLTEEAVRAIRISTESHSALARRYGVTHDSIRNVRTGRTWRHVDAGSRRTVARTGND